MKIKEVKASIVLDSRKDKTIKVSVKTAEGIKASASSPTGKSTGKHEKKSYIQDIDHDVKRLKELEEYFQEEEIEEFNDLKKVEDICDNHVGANTIFALESAILKLLAEKQKKEVWEIVYEDVNQFQKPLRIGLAKNGNNKEPKLQKPFYVGNAIGGGKHSEIDKQLGEKKPDFQEFLLITKDVKKLNKAYEKAKDHLKKIDEKFKGEKNDEGAWKTSLNDKLVLDVLYDLKEEFNLEIGMDIAASIFYKRKKFQYENPKLKRIVEEQFDYLGNLIKNYEILYIEDPFDEEDFENFAKLKEFVEENLEKSLVVGDDLTVTNLRRLRKALKEKAINAIIVKPNQIGSLIEVRDVCELAKKENIKIVFSHRSGETQEDILADLAFGFGADFFKCGISGKEREAKIERMEKICKTVLK